MKARKLSALSLLALWLFLAIPFVIIYFDWHFSRERDYQKQLAVHRQNTRNLLELMQTSCSWDVQASRKLDNFHRTLRSNLNAANSKEFVKIITETYNSQIKDKLPPHHIAITVGDPQQSALSFSTAAGTNNLLSLSEAIVNNRNHNEASRILEKMVNFKSNTKQLFAIQDAIDSKDEGILLPFNSMDSSKWLYWFCPENTENRLFISVLFDAQQINDTYAYTALQDFINHSNTAMAVLPLSPSGKPFWSEKLHKNPLLAAHLKNRYLQFPLYYLNTQHKEYDIHSTPTLTGIPAILILASRIPNYPPLSQLEFILLSLTCLVFAFLSLLLLQRELTGRGYRISIGVVLLSALISVFYLPAGLARMAATQAIDEYIETEKVNLEMKLERNLYSMEDGFTLALADHYYRIKNIDQNPKILALIDSGKLKQALSFIDDKVTALYPTKLGTSFIAQLIHTESGSDALYIRHLQHHDYDKMFAPLMRSFMQRFRPDLTAKKQTDSSLSLEGVKEEMVTDFLMSFFKGILGHEMFYYLMANPDRLIVADSTFTSANASLIMIKPEGVIKALMLTIWSSFFEQEHYLKYLKQNSATIFENFQFIALRKTVFKSDHVASTRDMPIQAWEISARSRRAEIMLTSKELLDSDQLIFKSLPAKEVGLYLLTAFTSLKHIFARQLKFEKGFNTAMMVGLFFLLLLVAAIYWYFMNPLIKLQKALMLIQSDNFKTRLADSERKDEFGKINSTFNLMAKGLEEGSLLGKFVSSAVVNMIRDKAAFNRALAGEKRPMTIVFASIDLPANIDVHQLVKQLEINLTICQNSVRETCGVIDKVMEEKILIFFDHEICGGADKAVNQSLQVITQMKTQLSQSGLTSYFGLATGTVVAGILGARNIRLDYTVIGDAVNLSARLNSTAKTDNGSRVIFDMTTNTLFPCHYRGESLGAIQIKGKTEPVATFRLLGHASGGTTNYQQD